MSRFIERLIEREIDSANDHLPVRRIPLSELVDSDSPSFKTRGGEDSVFLKAEISMLAEEVPSVHHGSIMLPIVILRRRDLGSGIYTVPVLRSNCFLFIDFLNRMVLDGMKSIVGNQPSDMQDRRSRFYEGNYLQRHS